MIRVALRGLAGRKFRAALTALAIVLGVAMVSGTYVLTDTISTAFDSIFQGTYRGTDAVVTARTKFTNQENGDLDQPTFPASVLDDVRSLSTVRDALGGVAGEAQIIGEDGKAVVFGGAPNLGFGVGDVIGIQGTQRVQRMRLSGLVKFGAVASIGGATLAGFDLPTAQGVFDKEGRLDQIRVAGKPGVSRTALLRELRSELPRSLTVRTGTAQADEDAAGTNEFISFLQKFLLAFGGIALFVGSFVIANSLSITIAQRTREF